MLPRGDPLVSRRAAAPSALSSVPRQPAADLSHSPTRCSLQTVSSRRGEGDTTQLGQLLLSGSALRRPPPGTRWCSGSQWWAL